MWVFILLPSTNIPVVFQRSMQKAHFNPKEGLIPRSLLRNKLMTNEVSLGLIPRSLLRGVSFVIKFAILFRSHSGIFFEKIIEMALAAKAELIGNV